MTQKLVRWETPFTDARFPSVVAFVTQSPEETSFFPVEVIVSPSGLDAYPKYRVSFGHPVAFSAMEEMHFPEIYFNDAEYEDGGNSCAYKFVDSPWIESYNRGEYFLFNNDGGKSETLSHFVIFGGDDVFQVVTRHIPTVETITALTTVTIKLSF